MSRAVYRYALTPGKDAVEAALVLALSAVEALHGEANARLDAAHFLDGPGKRLVIDAGTRAGRDLNRLFVRFLTLRSGPDAFRVERVPAAPRPQTRPAKVRA